MNNFDDNYEFDSADAVKLIGDKWAIDVLHELRDGKQRYNQMHRNISGISRKMLTQTLRKLERNGIVERVDFETTPPHVEYSVTPEGEELIKYLTFLCKWAKTHQNQITERQKSYDAKKTGWI